MCSPKRRKNGAEQSSYVVNKCGKMRAACHDIQTAIVQIIHHSVAMAPRQVIAQLLYFSPKITVSRKLWLVAHCPLSAFWALAIIGANIDPDLCCHMASLGSNELNISFGYLSRDEYDVVTLWIDQIRDDLCVIFYKFPVLLHTSMVLLLSKMFVLIWLPTCSCCSTTKWNNLVKRKGKYSLPVIFVMCIRGAR